MSSALIAPGPIYTFLSCCNTSALDKEVLDWLWEIDSNKITSGISDRRHDANLGYNARMKSDSREYKISC